MAGPGTVDGRKIELRPLTDAQQQDALFQLYDERNIDKVGSAFRLPRAPARREQGLQPVHRRDARCASPRTRSSSPSATSSTSSMNRKLLADMGIRFWRFRSQTPVTRDPERMTEMPSSKLVRVGVLTPEEGRILAGDIFNREFRKIPDDWVRAAHHAHAGGHSDRRRRPQAQAGARRTASGARASCWRSGRNSAPRSSAWRTNASTSLGATRSPTASPSLSASSTRGSQREAMTP